MTFHDVFCVIFYIILLHFFHVLLFLECYPEETHGGTYTKLHDSFGMVVNSTIYHMGGLLAFKFRFIALRLRSFTLKKEMVFLDLLQLLVGLLVNPV